MMILEVTSNDGKDAANQLNDNNTDSISSHVLIIPIPLVKAQSLTLPPPLMPMTFISKRQLLFMR
eukprot:scaffold470735_cov20-Prasinocladus_malaysianus.AAC.1